MESNEESVLKLFYDCRVARRLSGGCRRCWGLPKGTVLPTLPLAGPAYDALSWWKSCSNFTSVIITLIFLLSWWKSCSNFTSVIITLIFLLSWYGLFFLRKPSNKSLPLPPGPRGLPLVGNLFSLDPELHTYFSSLSKRYGPVFSLKLGSKLCVVVNSPQTAFEVLRTHDVTFANRDPAAVTAAFFGGKDIVWTPYGAEWRMVRKVCMQVMLNTSTLDASYPLRRREVRKAIAYLYTQTGSPVNVAEHIFLATLNIITSMLWGGGSLPSTKTALMGAEFQKVVADVVDLLGAPNVSDFFPILAALDLQGNLKKMRKEIEKLEKIYDVLIDERSKMGGEGKDLLQVLLTQLKSGGDEKTPMTMNHVKAILTNLIVGGTDTTSNTIELAMSELINHPQVMAKAQEELDTVVGKNTTVEESHIHQLPYLYAIIKETLRLHSVIPNLVPHSPSKMCTIGGYTIPKGACVFINVYKIHNDPTYWTNPDNFEPERFLNVEMDFNGSDFRFLPFGSGRRSCAGLVMAQRMLVFSLATLLHSFDWKSLDGEKLDMSEKFGIVLKKKSPLFAIPSPRLSDPLLYE